MPFPQMNPSLAEALSERGYGEPTAVQSAVLAKETGGRDLLVSAETGSGKTVAFGAALAPTLLGAEAAFGPAGAPLALIVAPTRELALQVERELTWLYAKAGGRIASCVGGMDIRREARALEQGCHIVVGTPGRLKDHLARGRLDLSQLRAVVLDEADEMLDMGFKEDLEFILDRTPAGRRTLLFSATIAREIETLATRYQKDALRIATARGREPHADIEYQAVRVAGSEIERALVNVLRFHDAGAAIVFCSTREGVKRLHGSLMERGFAAVALSGELTQAERTSALQSLRDRRARVCVATDVAARGLDLPDLGLVIHADLPNDKETLLHRSGRTGRAGRKGLCVLIVPVFKRRRAESLLRFANINAAWTAAPTAEEIRAKDQIRILQDAVFAEQTPEDDVALARTMLETRPADEIAQALVKLLRAKLPAPEEVSDPGAGSFKDRRPMRDHEASPRGERAERGPPRERLNAEDTVWFRINVGRTRNADPRWLIPLICKAGGITKASIGQIRIFDGDSRFQISKADADAFAAAVSGKSENNTIITPAFGAEGRPPHADKPRAMRDARPPFKGKPAKRTWSDADKPARAEGQSALSTSPTPSKPRWKDGKPHWKKDKPAADDTSSATNASPAAEKPRWDATKPHWKKDKPGFKKPWDGARPVKAAEDGAKPVKPYKFKKKHKSIGA